MGGWWSKGRLGKSGSFGSVATIFFIFCNRYYFVKDPGRVPSLPRPCRFCSNMSTTSRKSARRRDEEKEQRDKRAKERQERGEGVEEVDGETAQKQAVGENVVAVPQEPGNVVPGVALAPDRGPAPGPKGREDIADVVEEGDVVVEKAPLVPGNEGGGGVKPEAVSDVSSVLSSSGEEEVERVKTQGQLKKERKRDANNRRDGDFMRTMMENMNAQLKTLGTIN
jgi:hypothetical protein